MRHVPLSDLYVLICHRYRIEAIQLIFDNTGFYMSTKFDAFKSLREAVRLSPDNIPLRQHFAEALMSKGLFDEAEKEFRAALAFSAENVQLKLGLAHAFFKQNKKSAALVVLEDLLSYRDVPAKAYLLYARLLLKTGERIEASEAYRKAIHLDPTLADPTLSEQLGIANENKRDLDEREDDLFPLPNEMPEDAVEISIEKPDSNFSDVGGMEALKDEIRLKVIYPLSHPEVYEAYGRQIGGGILMYGPPDVAKLILLVLRPAKSRQALSQLAFTMCWICGSAIANAICTISLNLPASANHVCSFSMKSTHWEPVAVICAAVETGS